MNEPRKFEMPEEALEQKLYKIRTEHGIDATLLFALVNSPQGNALIGPRLSKHAKRKLQRRLQGSEATFNKIEGLIVQHQQTLRQVPDAYQQSIYARLTAEQKQAYDSGRWTPEILEVVSSAQRAHYPQRAPSPSETQPRVHFTPAGEYRKNWNR